MNTMSNPVGHIQDETALRHLGHGFLPPLGAIGALFAVGYGLDKGYIGGDALPWFINAVSMAALGYGIGTFFALSRETKASDGKSFVNVRTS